MSKPQATNEQLNLAIYLLRKRMHTPIDLLKKFRIMAIEFHSFHNLRYQYNLDNLDSLRKIIIIKRHYYKDLSFKRFLYKYLVL